MTYAVDGVQYVAVLAGRGGGAGLVGGPTGKRWQKIINENMPPYSVLAEVDIVDAIVIKLLIFENRKHFDGILT